MTEPVLLFVYGTLRRDAGHAMGAWLAARAEWRGVAHCAPARLYRVDWYPALAPGAQAGEVVTGDLYALQEAVALWPALDEFEGVSGHDGDEYERRRVDITGPAGERLQAWAYWYRRPVVGLERIVSGDWLRR
ncbi:MAG: hypothetical protein K0S46_1065 [Moraxellaceae bacterium]|nr:hypothetical protein [Moraxellaceae bacterium]